MIFHSVTMSTLHFVSCRQWASIYFLLYDASMPVVLVMFYECAHSFCFLFFPLPFPLAVDAFETPSFGFPLLPLLLAPALAGFFVALIMALFSIPSSSASSACCSSPLSPQPSSSIVWLSPASFLCYCVSLVTFLDVRPRKSCFSAQEIFSFEEMFEGSLTSLRDAR